MDTGENFSPVSCHLLLMMVVAAWAYRIRIWSIIILNCVALELLISVITANHYESNVKLIFAEYWLIGCI
jgi:hypothetical protein